LLLNPGLIAIRNIVVSFLVAGLVWREHAALHPAHERIYAVFLVEA
jgi:hypothetical protein